MNPRPPHLLPGQSPERRAQLLHESPLEAWRDEVSRGGMLSADKLAALFLVLGLIFTQLALVTTPAQAAVDTYRDEFAAIAFDGTDGTIDWSGTPWGEGGESDGAGDGSPSGGGQLSVVTDNTCGVGNNCLQIRADDSGVYTLTRDVDLSSATAATLSFDYYREYINGVGGSTTILEISDDGGSGWDTLAVFIINSPGDSGFNPASIDLSAYSSPNALLQFRTDGSGLNATLYVDDFQVEVTTPDPNVVLVNSTGDGSDNNAGDDVCNTGGTNAQGAVECTLRAAIEEANASGTVDTIHFKIPQNDGGYASSPEQFTIQPGTLLPEISTAMTIDGSTQLEFDAHNRPVIEVDGVNVSAGEENGFWITGGGTTIRSLAIGRFGDDAIDIETNGGNTIVGNYIGTDVTGTVARANAWGVNIKTAGNIVGGTTAADRNVVSGNTDDGFYIYNSSATGNVIQGNYVGVDATGTTALGNGEHGMNIFSGANGNTIGGATSAHGNVVSGNGSGEAGIYVTGASTSGNVLRYNRIGTNAAGTAAIPNNLHGIWIDDAPDTDVFDNLISGNDVHGMYIYDTGATGTEILRNTIGTNLAVDTAIPNAYDGIRLEGNSRGTTIGSAGNGNVISGNTQHGVNINSASDNTVQANIIGTDSGGTTDLGNGWSGVYFDSFNPANNLIGGETGGEGNTIAFNGEGITSISPQDNAFLRNHVYSNDSLGIDMDDDGMSANGAGDPLDFPVITSATESGGTVTVYFTYGAPDGDYRIEFFDNTAADGSGNGEGETWVGSVDVAVAGGTPSPESTTFSGSAGDVITATATEGASTPFGATSEFSAAYTATASGPTPIARPDPQGGTTSDRYPAAVKALTPTSYWRLGESSGPTAFDEMFANDGTYSAPTPGTAGALAGDADTAADFDGIDDYVDVGTFDLAGGGLTLTGWINADSFAIADARVITKATDIQEADHIWMLSTVGASGETRLRTRLQAGGSTDTLFAASGALQVGQWHFAAVTYDQTDIRLYLDGVEVGSASHSVGGPVDAAPTLPVWIGANPPDASVKPFDGRIDEVAVFDRALTVDELRQLHAAGRQYYTINEGGSLSTSSLEGTLTNDTDPNGDALTASVVSGPSNADSFTLNADGSFDYTPTPTFSGTDSFVYSACNTDPVCDNATTTITVVPSGSPTVTFQNGTDGYTGTVDSWFTAGFPDVDNSAAVALEVDGSAYQQGVIRFDGIIGSGAGQIPAGSTVTDATLSIVLQDPTAGAANLALHRILTPWLETDTWNDWGSGVAMDDVEAAATADVVFSGSMTTVDTVIDIAGLDAAVQAWVDGSSNYGWLLHYDATDGIDIRSSENGSVAWRPLLSVTYTPPAACADSDGDGLCDLEEDWNTDADNDPATNPGPNTDGDANPNYLDSDDDGDGTPTASENADPNADGDPRDAVDSDWDGQPDYLDAPSGIANGTVESEQKISDLIGGFGGVLDNNDRFGTSVASIGDIDGDGVVDAAVGAFWDDDGGTNRGAVYVLFLNSDGTVRTEQKISDTAGSLGAAFADEDSFGIAVAGIGDLDGDGIGDIAVGAYKDDDGGYNRGAVHILFLNSNGTVKAEQKISDTVGGLAAVLEDEDFFGVSLAGIGDLDGDGLQDIVVGAQWDDDGGAERGAAYVLLLNADGTVKAEQKISHTAGGFVAALDNDDRFGTSVAGIGDLDGDGVNDIAVAAHYDDDGGTDRGAVYVLFLNSNGTVKGQQKISDTSGGLTATLDNGDRLGRSVGATGDVDGDGVADLVVGAYNDDDGGTDRGAVYVLFLNSNGTVKSEQKISDTAGGLVAALDNGDEFGTGAAGIGDVDGDGRIDLLVGTRDDDDGGTDRGAVYIVNLAETCADSDSDGLCDLEEDANTDADNDPATNPGPNTDGDANPNYLDDDDDGDGTATASENADPNGDGNPRDAEDVDRDVEPDYLDLPTTASSGLIAHEQLISETDGDLTMTLGVSDHFGRAVAPIGDLDGDGVNDLAVGVPNDDDGSSDRGAVFILFMNADGTVKGEQKISDALGGFTAVLDNADEFGIAVTGLGDLDGDLIPDVAVGAHQDDDGLNGNGGAVYVLFLNSGGTVKSYQKISETDGGLGVLFNANDRFGGSVANIGDLDGDGLNDIAVGAKDDDDGVANAGAVYVLFLNADGTVKGQQKISQTTGGLTGTPLGGSDGFGIGVAGLGDVDGDGLGDIAVGSYWDDDGGTNHGAAYVLMLNAEGTVKGQQKISDTEGLFTGALGSNDEFGTAVGALGDVDADGVPDLVVGTPKDDDGNSLSGAAYVLFLNSDGTVKAYQKISNLEGGLGTTINTSDQFGFAVAGIGDLDGDGTIGLAVGTFGDDDGFTDSGSVYIIDLAGPSTSLIVNSTDDAGDNNIGDGVCYTGDTNSALANECTLRAAIEEANFAADGDVIEFDMPVGEGGHSGGVWTISPASVFDQITQTVVIDGRTQPGWTTTPVVEINGSGAGAGGDGFRIAANNVEIRGLAINRFLADGIEIASGAADTVIAQNHIGLDASGLIDRGNAGRGVDLGAGSGPTTVGGFDVADRNVISGNGGDGIIIWDSNSNIILNNYIGTDVTGSAPFGNGADGIALGGTSSGNLIGASGDGNVISGNTNDGVENDATGINNAVYFNYIGMGADGTTPVPNGRHGVVIYDGANNTWVYQNLISSNTTTGVLIDGNGNAATTANNIVGNYIGIDLSSNPRPNGSHGVHVFGGATGNVIGGTTAGYRNTVSGNGSDGIRIDGAGTDSNRVENNHIGTNIAGDAAVPNGRAGVYLENGAASNTVGGATAGHRNVISGNTQDGIYITSVGSDGNTVSNNYIGTNAAGDAAIPNGDRGVQIESGASDNFIGVSGGGNVISGNTGDGVIVADWLSLGTTGNDVIDNLIGLAADGTTPLGNGANGIHLDPVATTLISGNTIAHNGSDGIVAESTTLSGNAIVGNSIHSNGQLGIDLENDGVTANDSGDGDGGPNDLLNFPVITSAVEIAGTVTVDFDLDVPAGDYRIEFFDSAAADPSGNGEGETFVDYYDVVAHPGGSASYSTTSAGSAGDIITATTTEEIAAPFGSTSEFSAAVTVADAYSISGTVFEDIAGELLNDGVIGDASNPGSVGVDVHLLDGAGTLIDTQVTDANGAYTFTGLSDGDYTVWVDSKTVPSAQDPSAVQGDIWAVQTYGPIDEHCEDGGASYANVAAGSCYGGAASSSLSDGESGFHNHQVQITVAGADVTATDFGFSFNVVTHTRGGDTEDDDTGANRTVQSSLRQFIQNANAISGPNAMRFVPVGPVDVTVGADSWWQVAVSNALPASTDADTDIDGTAYGLDDGTSVENTNTLGPELELSGSAGNGLEINANTNEVRDLVVNGFTSGIAVLGGDGTVIAGNYIGPDATGAVGEVGNSDEGLQIYGATDTVVGGTTAADRNVISGNRLRGILIDDWSDGAPYISNGTTVIGNYIGTNATGDATLPFDNSPQYQQIGIYILDSSDGVFGTAADGNVLSGNYWFGVYMWGPNATNNKFQGNIVGLDASGSAAVPNGWESASRGGIYLSNAPGNLIGGTNAGEGNVIASNTYSGVIVFGTGASDNAILSNEIRDNGALGIDLDTDGITANDAGDADDGGNELLNFPVITSATETGGTVTVDFDLDVPAGDYRIEFFTNTAADPSGNGEGESFVDSYDVVGHLGGSASYSTTFAGAVDDIITATTTEGTATPFGSTSEFSGAYTVTLPDTTAPVITLVGANPQTIEVGSAYVELGATALDDVDGDITGSIVIDASAVNTAVLGSYPVTYDVSDAAGNPAIQVTRTVEIVDTTVPVLTLLGANPMTIEVGGSYTEPGATASDNYDGDITGSIVINSSAVNTAVVGSYVVTYDVVDSSGNPASGFRTVNVVDTTVPVITLVGANPQTIEVGAGYTELGATALDNYDGDITGSIVIDATTVDTGVVGSYAVTYDVTDSEGNAAVQVTRTVDVVDTTVPVITLVGANPQTLEVGSAYVELGATAFDVGDGDISGSIVIDSSSVNTSVVGSYLVTYDVSDSQGNAAVQVTRAVDVVDTQVPVIMLVGANPQTIEVGSAYVELGATALDNYDGDLTGSIVIDATAVDTAVVGSYTATYNVTDSNGNAAVEVTRTVDVVDTTAPVITLVGANPQTIEVGSAYVELGATALDNYDGDLTGSVVINAASVNTALIGSYVVTYDVSDSEGNAAVQRTRVVDVVDTTAPVIALTGADPQTLEVNTAYVELGATASDNYDGDISGSIVIDASVVLPGTVGSYPVTYDVTDSEGNAAVQVTRTVDVVDTQVPVITLLGANPQTIEVGAGYTELGATATDNYDGDISGSIVIDASAVLSGTVGSYAVTYDVSDSEGNAAVQVTRTVDVVDTTVPVVTLIGANPQVIEVGAGYAELGATATDNYDGDISGSIVIDASAVLSGTVGSYAVTYDVTDSEGNAAVQVTRTVDVVDTTLPVITLVGANPQVIEVGSGYTELGATATDNYDGDVSGSIVINSSAVNTSAVGSYLVTYNVSDANGNAAVQVTRTVDVVDTTIPVITLIGANPQTIEVGSGYTELGATATDNYDGDLTGSIVIDSSAVNTAVVGSYLVTYNVSDANGNAAVQVTRTVDVVDTTIPVITLIGANPQTIEVGSGYTELGATATDNYDGDLTGSIVIDSSAVNTAVVGTYSVTYNVSDANGNAAVQVTRTVDVVDTTIPVITLVGANPQTVEVGSAYVELGATATDNYDGDISGSIVINASAVVTSVVGSYTVTYDVTDSEGNAAVQVTRTVDVVDTTAPVITLIGANPQVIEAGSAYVELGATAFDIGDGDVTGSIVVDSSAVDTATVGSYPVTYDVTDSHGNAATQATRTVDVIDTTAPVITLIGANPQTLEVNTAYVELGATAADIGDGDLTASIVIDVTGVNMAAVGSYSVTYDVTDSQGNAAVQVTRVVDVVDTTAPVITLIGANPQTIEAGSPYVELGATALDNYDGDITPSIVIDATAVDTAVVGSYPVTYDSTDSEGNAATQVTRTVDVVDTTAPIITLVGPNPQVIEVGSAYAELGATAFDIGDGDITPSIAIDATAVDIAVVGTYSVTYDVTDSQGNAAVQVTRTVDIVDTTLPVITLVGANPQNIEAGSLYVELGATATDNYDGDITPSIVIDATAVDTATVGSYSVTYNVTDANGNAAIQVTRTVNITDTTAPVISLVGPNPQVIEVGSAYVELGATAFDIGDGDISGSIVIDATAVDTAVVGSYGVTYDVTDSQGNAAIQVIRTVDIVDTTLPVIALTGANPQVIEVGSPYVELGATATDNYDGDLTSSIVINAGGVLTTAVGSYVVTYDVTDANGNAAIQVVRTVDVVDTTAPVISLVGPNPQVIEVGSAYVELGATAFDIGDGDISGSIVIDATAVNTGVVGSYGVTYDVTDSQGNAATQVTRTVNIVDTTLPGITLIGANPQVIEVGSPYTELGATALDNYDGDISGSIVIDATWVNTGVVGTYAVTYDVTDSNGNAAVQVTRTVGVVDTTVPVITLVGPNPQVIEVGSPYVEQGATALDNYDGDISGSIVIDATAVNTAVLGSYPVTYDVTDSNGNAAVQVTRTVDVVDTTLPVITLVGPNPQVIEVGSLYVEQGATAFDNYDGDISGSIVINASAVNTNVVGTYVVTYDVVDSSGNPAVAFRTVDVVDTTVPVITLVGPNPQTIEVHSPYSELGATALDNYDGDISGSIVVDASAVNTAVVGTYFVTYDVTDSNGNAAVQVTRTVDVVDTIAPVITLLGADPQTVGVGSPYVELGATALDNYDGDISGSIVIDSSAVNTAVVGAYVVTYNVTDSNGNAAIQLTRTVDVVNVAPTLNFIGDQTVAETTLATFTATATDPDPTDVLAFSLIGAPAGAGIDPVTGIFTWTPTEAQGPGIFAFDVVVTDSAIPALSDAQTVTITVTEVNLPPVLGLIPPQTVDEITVLSFVAPASDPDVPANARTFILTGAPVGATIDPATGVFTWLPSEAQGPGTYVFDITVSDGGTPVLSDSQPVTVTVNEVNLAPMVASPGPQSSAEADVVTLPIAASDVDLPANTLAYSATGLPDGLTIDPATGVISGTIAYTAHASSPFDVVVTVTDDGVPNRSGQTAFTWTVADTNRSPIPGSDSVITAEDTTLVVHALINDTDPDGDPLTIIGFSTPANGSVIIAGNRLEYTPDPNYNGPDSFRYTIADGRGGFAIGTVGVSVAAVNDAPHLNALTLLNVDEGTAAIFVVSATDVEGNTVTFSLAGQPSGAVIDPSSGRFAWTPAESQGPGSYIFEVVGTDDGSPSAVAARQVRINVAEVNEAPIVTNPGTTITAENRTVSLAVTATDPDIPVDTLRYTASGLPPGLSMNPATGEITGVVPFDGAVGSPYSVTIVVTDDGVPARSTSVGFSWIIANTNRPPTAHDMVVFAEAGVASSLVLNGSDPDGDPLSFRIAGQPTQGTLTGGPRLFDYTAPISAGGSDSFTFVVSDGDLEATGTATISITPNLPPSGGPDEYTVRAGGVLAVEAPGVLGNDRDPEGEPITAVVDTPPEYGVLILESDGSFTYRNTGDLADIDVFSYRIDDGMQLSPVISVIVNFVENIAPTVENDSVVLDEDTSAVFFPLENDTDANDEPIIVKNVTPPAHGTVDWSLDGAFVYRPQRDWNGTETITYQITDGDLVSTGVITLEVRPVNDAPVAVAADVTGQSGEPLMIDLRPYATDVDGDALEFLLESSHEASITKVSPGIFAVDLDGVIRDLPPLTFIVSDPSGAKDTSLLTVTVQIPAELVGVPSLVSADIPGNGSAPAVAQGSEPPAGGPIVTGLRLMVGSVLDTFQAFRVPMLALLLVFAVSLFLGFSKKFVFSSAPTALPIVARRRMDVVMAPSSAGVPARSEPGSHQSVVHRFAADETGIVATGSRSLLRSETWVEVETPEGDAWVNAQFLTEQQAAAAFRDDNRPAQLIADFVERLYGGDDLLPVTGGRDLHVALYGPPVRFAAGALPLMLSGASVYWWWGPEGDTPRNQGTFNETVGESFSMAYRNREGHSLRSNLPIPVEFVNMHSLVVGNHELGEGWRVFFRYEDGEALIAGLMREAAPNPAAMLGRNELQHV